MRILTLLLALCPLPACAQLALRDQLPRWAAERWKSAAVQQLQLDLSGRINPFFQRGDFDGDGRMDLAVLVQHQVNHKIGLLILERNGKQALFGAGRHFDNGGDDFEWLDLWWVEERAKSEHRRSDPAVKLEGDGLMLAKEGSASALVYFKAGDFHWQQKGD